MNDTVNCNDRDLNKKGGDDEASSEIDDMSERRDCECGSDRSSKAIRFAWKSEREVEDQVEVFSTGIGQDKFAAGTERAGLMTILHHPELPRTMSHHPG